ncbi:unnamed protein product [Paramecium sonneborni]|uniref:Uncharacterized protein n=1 Tax=Paramecium sonneborni TaxID=65129 RepID=A0A8S1LI01_9CILI|nr:unnamed protein product [Paramecium sonneborni]
MVQIKEQYLDWSSFDLRQLCISKLLLTQSHINIVLRKKYICMHMILHNGTINFIISGSNFKTILHI